MEAPLPRKRRCNVFFVDTKSTCFLCLSEIPTVIDLDSEEQASGQEGQEQNERRQFSMRTIYKYLKINTGKLLTSKVVGGNNAQLLKTDLAVPLCESCETITDNLSKLCLELELVQMKVNHWLQQFFQQLRKSEEDATKLAKFRNKMQDPLELLQASVADLMRKETEAKCSKRLEGVFPIVNMASVKKAMITTNTPVSVPTLTKTSTSSTSGPTTFTPAILASAHSDLPPPPPPPLDVAFSSVFKPASFKCPLCQVPFTSDSGFRHHQVRRHPELPHLQADKIIPKLAQTCNACGIKLPSKADWIRHTRLYCSVRRCTKSEFPKKFKKSPAPPALIPVTSIATVVSPPPPPPVPTLPASIPELTSLINHLPHKKTNMNTLECSLCPNLGAGYNSDHQLRNHVFCVHPWYFFKPIQFAECTSAQFDKLVGDLIASELDSCSCDNASTDNTWKCTMCDNVMYNKRAMNIHLIQCHYKELCEKLMELQKDMGLTQQLANPTMTLAPQPEVNDKMAELDAKRNFHCKDCGTGFVQSSTLYRHVRNNCPKRKYPRYWVSPEENVEEATTETNKRRPVGALGAYKCDICGAGFAHSTSLWRHKRQTHKNKKYENNSINAGKPGHSSYQPGDGHVCSVCEKVFPKWRNFRRHVNRNSCQPPLPPEEGFQNQGQNENEIPVISGSFSLANPVPISVVPMMVQRPVHSNVVIVEENYHEQDEGQLFFGGGEDEEQEEEQNFQEGYTNGNNIQVMEADQIHLREENHGGNVKLEMGVMAKVENPEGLFLDNDQDMILPDSEDPLQF